MSTILLHIGYPKTGTSAIQWFLHENRHHLRSQGVCYPITGQADDHGHHLLVQSLSRGGDGAGGHPLVDELKAEIAASGCDTVVLSSELFLLNLEQVRDGCPPFRALLDGSRTHAVCFLRRQDSFLESLYRQFVWDPDVRLADDCDAFLAGDHAQGGAYVRMGDYALVVDAWAGFIGREHMHTVVYEQALRAGGCIGWLCALLGLDVATLTGADPNVQRNAAIGGTLGTEIMRAINRYEGLSAAQRTELARKAIELERTVTSARGARLFSAGNRARIESLFLESNRRLAEEFVGQPLDGFWFPDVAPAGSPGPIVAPGSLAG